MVAQFRCVDAAVIRVAVLGSELDLPPWPDLTGDTPIHLREWRSWLRRVWQQKALVEAIKVASTVLARRVQDVCDGQVQQPRRVRRVVESVVRYLGVRPVAGLGIPVRHVLAHTPRPHPIGWGRGVT